MEQKGNRLSIQPYCFVSAMHTTVGSGQTEVLLYPHRGIPWVQLEGDERIVPNTWFLLFLRAWWM